MEERNNYNLPYLIALKSTCNELMNFKKITLSGREHTIGRGLDNSTTIPIITMSRNHCKIMKLKHSDWYLFDYSTCGIEINGVAIGKGSHKKLSNGDIIKMEPSDKLTYKFVLPHDDEYNVPSKRIKLSDNTSNSGIINDVKVKFQQTQDYERSNIKQKMEDTKQKITKSMILKEQLESDMGKKKQQLENDYALQIEKLTGAKNVVEQKTNLLIKERDAHIIVLQKEMGSKIAELMEQIRQHNDKEVQLSKENCLLKEKLENERRAFMVELLRENSSKHGMLSQLENKIKEQENIRKREKEELEKMHKQENEQLRLAMEKELKDLEEKKKQREDELKNELNSIKDNLKKRVQETEEQELKAKQELMKKLEIMRQLSDIEKGKVEKLEKEKEEMEQKHTELLIKAKDSISDLKNQVKRRESELKTLTTKKASKKQIEESKVIENLTQKLEKANNKLKEHDKTITQEIEIIDLEAGTSTKESVLNKVGNIMESEFQCTICAELFIEATTLGCCHTFCAYCINMWKKKKRDCPICRTPIKSICRSLVLDSFIEKMVENLTHEFKVKRQDMLQYRKDQKESLVPQMSLRGRSRRRRGRSTRRSTTSTPSTTIQTHIPIVDLTMIPSSSPQHPDTSEISVMSPGVTPRRGSRVPVAAAAATGAAPTNTRRRRNSFLHNLPIFVSITR